MRRAILGVSFRQPKVLIQLELTCHSKVFYLTLLVYLKFLRSHPRHFNCSIFW